MHPPPIPAVPEGSQNDATRPDNSNGDVPSSRRESVSQQSEGSQTAGDFLRDQRQLEADAREALPYILASLTYSAMKSFKNCTKPLGSLRQNVYACLTCNPPPPNPDSSFAPAGICYSCSVQCHGEHELVEIFKKRNFTCDCGTTRFKPDQPCKLRLDPNTNAKGNVHSEQPDPNNKYTQNFQNRFCSCSIDYVPNEQMGTMFQCLGLGTHETGGCGEEWYHPGCLVGQGPKWYEKLPKRDLPRTDKGGNLAPIYEGTAQERGDGQPTTETDNVEDEEDTDVPLPEGFPGEDEFDFFLCYKCVEAYPWIKRYAGTPSFLPAVFLRKPHERVGEPLATKKRKQEDDDTDNIDGKPTKRVKDDPNIEEEGNLLDLPVLSKLGKGEDVKDEMVSKGPECKLALLPPASNGVFSIFLEADFRDHLCHCPSCFPNLKPHPQLLEPEEEYEPSLSDPSDNGSTHGSGSLYERGESALKTIDRVRAIEGIAALNNLKEKLKPFFQQFVESGKAISAEDITQYFRQLRGDEEATKEASEAAEEDHRREQSGY
ncbi:hypothetical protein ONZ43_g1509 [Nemania bipapillata]|uniref:Uncharacterized protein n=1 Tax=Nemania bipapillata TaxID=110536 RepID=A0ACC2J454_9PEZI|nr:hypothetical protein ONZ43_g1509 [Nemania bipapillata]